MSSAAYIIATKDPSVSKMKLEILDPVIHYQLVEVINYNIIDHGLFHLSFNKLDNHSVFFHIQILNKVIRFIDTIGFKLNPFAYSYELLD